MNFERFGESTLQNFVDKLVAQCPSFHFILLKYGYPPFWHREPTFETLVRIILEQQVSLASAKAAYDKLVEKITIVTPQNLLSLTDEELKACYFSRQKTKYTRHLSEAIISKKLDIEALNQKTDVEIRTKLTQIKGIGNWTVDVYLLMSLHHADIFPIGDLAAVNALKMLGFVPNESSKEDILTLMESAKPYRSVATYLLWHSYIREKGIKV